MSAADSSDEDLPHLEPTHSFVGGEEGQAVVDEGPESPSAMDLTYTNHFIFLEKGLHFQDAKEAPTFVKQCQQLVKNGYYTGTNGRDYRWVEPDAALDILQKEADKSGRSVQTIINVMCGLGVLHHCIFDVLVRALRSCGGEVPSAEVTYPDHEGETFKINIGDAALVRFMFATARNELPTTRDVSMDLWTDLIFTAYAAAEENRIGICMSSKDIFVLPVFVKLCTEHEMFEGIVHRPDSEIEGPYQRLLTVWAVTEKFTDQAAFRKHQMEALGHCYGLIDFHNLLAEEDFEYLTIGKRLYCNVDVVLAQGIFQAYGFLREKEAEEVKANGGAVEPRERRSRLPEYFHRWDILKIADLSRRLPVTSDTTVPMASAVCCVLGIGLGVAMKLGLHRGLLHDL